MFSEPVRLRQRENSLGCDDKNPLEQPSQLQFPKDQTGLDGLAQADLIGEEVANAVAGHRTGEGV